MQEKSNMEELTRMLNYKMHAGILFIPLLNGLEVKESEFPQSILLAQGNGIIEQIVSDGHIEENEFENRIQIAIDSAKEYMKENNCEKVDESISFYKDYSNGIFKYKVYIQDVIKEIEGQKCITRMLNAFFIEPKMKDMYQVTISAGAFTMPETEIQLGKLDLENDEVAKTINNLLHIVLDNLRYN